MNWTDDCGSQKKTIIRYSHVYYCYPTIGCRVHRTIYTVSSVFYDPVWQFPVYNVHVFNCLCSKIIIINYCRLYFSRYWLYKLLPVLLLLLFQQCRRQLTPWNDDGYALCVVTFHWKLTVFILSFCWIYLVFQHPSILNHTFSLTMQSFRMQTPITFDAVNH